MTIEQDKIFRLACDISDGTVSAIDGSHTIHQLIRKARIDELNELLDNMYEDGYPDGCQVVHEHDIADRIEQLNRSKAE